MAALSNKTFFRALSCSNLTFCSLYSLVANRRKQAELRKRHPFEKAKLWILKAQSFQNKLLVGQKRKLEGV